MPEIKKNEDLWPLYAALDELGFTENEQRLYVTSLNQGPLSISRLAELLAIPRPNVYKIIEGLVSKGLIDSRARLRYAKNLTVEPPSVVSELLKERRKEQFKVDHAFIDKLPTYMDNFQQGAGPLKVKVMVGQKDFEKIYIQMYEEAQQEILFCGSLRDFDLAFGRDLVMKNVEKRLEKDIKGIALLLPMDRGYYSAAEHKAQRREVRYLEGFEGFATSFHIFSNKVVFYQPKAPMAVLVEDEYIVTMMKSLFTGLWAGASEK
ncbi:MAG: helix-turn-helix domain-containing protein [Patescibacteria group bacterium]|jgi:sugar-specific transcriptional regulator TrmB